jgi:hypothetical protein
LAQFARTWTVFDSTLYAQHHLRRWALALAVSALALGLVKRDLKIADTFPEILRLPLVGESCA